MSNAISELLVAALNEEAAALEAVVGELEQVTSRHQRPVVAKAVAAQEPSPKLGDSDHANDVEKVRDRLAVLRARAQTLRDRIES